MKNEIGTLICHHYTTFNVSSNFIGLTSSSWNMKLELPCIKLLFQLMKQTTSMTLPFIWMKLIVIHQDQILWTTYLSLSICRLVHTLPQYTSKTTSFYIKIYANNHLYLHIVPTPPQYIFKLSSLRQSHHESLE